MGNKATHEPITGEEIQHQKQIKLEITGEEIQHQKQIKLEKEENIKNQQITQFHKSIGKLYTDLCRKVRKGNIELNNYGLVSVQMRAKNYLYYWVVFGDIMFIRSKGDPRNDEKTTHVIDMIEAYCNKTPGIPITEQFNTYVKDYLNQKFGCTRVLTVSTMVESTEYDFSTKITLSAE